MSRLSRSARWIKRKNCYINFIVINRSEKNHSLIVNGSVSKRQECLCHFTRETPSRYDLLVAALLSMSNLKKYKVFIIFEHMWLMEVEIRQFLFNFYMKTRNIV